MPFLRYKQPTLINQIGAAVGHGAGKFLRLAGGSENKAQAQAELNQLPADMDPLQYQGAVGEVLRKYNLRPGPIVQNMIRTQAGLWGARQAGAAEASRREAASNFLRQAFGAGTVQPEQFVQQPETPGGAVPIFKTAQAGSNFLRAQQQADAFADAASSAVGAGIPIQDTYTIRKDILDREAQARQAQEDAKRWQAEQAFLSDKFDWSKQMDEKQFNLGLDKARRDFIARMRSYGLEDARILQDWKKHEQNLREKARQFDALLPLKKAEAAGRGSGGVGGIKTSDIATGVRTVLSLYGGDTTLPEGMDPNSMEAALYMLGSARNKDKFNVLRSRADSGDKDARRNLGYINWAIAKMQELQGFRPDVATPVQQTIDYEYDAQGNLIQR